MSAVTLHEAERIVACRCWSHFLWKAPVFGFSIVRHSNLGKTKVAHQFGSMDSVSIEPSRGMLWYLTHAGSRMRKACSLFFNYWGYQEVLCAYANATLLFLLLLPRQWSARLGCNTPVAPCKLWHSALWMLNHRWFRRYIKNVNCPIRSKFRLPNDWSRSF
jgi:hypothetical protein